MTASRSIVAMWRAIAELISLDSRRLAPDNAAALQKLRTLVAALHESPWPTVLSAPPANGAGSVRSPAIARALEYLDTHASQTVRLSGVSRAAGLSVRLLTKEFRRATGLTVHEYLTRRRMVEAIRLLVMSDLKVAVIATSVGFRDPSTLYRQFTERLRSTPKAIRADRESAAAALRQLGTSALDSQDALPDLRGD